MSVFLFKDGGRMGMVAEVRDPIQFRLQFSKLLAAMIDNESYNGDWEFQLDGWLGCYAGIESKLTQLIVEKSDYKDLKTMSFGNISGDKVAQYIDIAYVGVPVQPELGEPIIEVPPSFVKTQREKEIETLRAKVKDLQKQLTVRTKQVIELQNTIVNRDK